MDRRSFLLGIASIVFASPANAALTQGTISMKELFLDKMTEFVSVELVDRVDWSSRSYRQFAEIQIRNAVRNLQKVYDMPDFLSWRAGSRRIRKNVITIFIDFSFRVGKGYQTRTIKRTLILP